MPKTSKKQWRRVVAAQERSGLTVREFAEMQGINATTLYWWRSKLRRDGAKLVPVQVVERAREGKGGSSSSSFELQVDGTMTLRVPAGFDEAELRRLIRALRC